MSSEFISLSCSGKVFILGEYACLTGAKALVIANKPRFLLNARSHSEFLFPFAKESPAGIYFYQLLEKNPALKNISFEWHDPYAVPIGVGSSSAQFILTVGICSHFLNTPMPVGRALLDLYWNTVGSSQGLRPSGLDVLIQASGGAFVYANEPYFSENLGNISFWENRFLLAFTGLKAKTHEHLLKLQKKGWPEKYNSCIDSLSTITSDGILAWKNQDAKKLGVLLNQFQEELFQSEIAPLEIRNIFSEILGWDGVYGCKGSGAQGGDCILFLINPEDKEQLEFKIKEKGWSSYPLEIDSNPTEINL